MSVTKRIEKLEQRGPSQEETSRQENHLRFELINLYCKALEGEGLTDTETSRVKQLAAMFPDGPFTPEITAALTEARELMAQAVTGR
jgi:hypothetical protein